MEAFWHQGKDDFYNRLLNEDEFLLVKAEQMTCIQGENFEFCVQTKNKEMAQKLFVKFNEKEIKHVRIDETNDKYSQPAYSVWYQYPAEKKESIALIFGQEKSIRMLSFTAVHQ